MDIIVGTKNDIVDRLSFKKVSRAQAFGVETTYKQALKMVRADDNYQLITWHENNSVVLYMVLYIEDTDIYVARMCGNGGHTRATALLQAGKMMIKLLAKGTWTRVYWHVYGQNTHARRGYDMLLKMAAKHGFTTYCDDSAYLHDCKESIEYEFCK